jgi:hypothetical protein
MPVRAPRLGLERRLVLWGDGIHDDLEAIQHVLDGGVVYTPEGHPTRMPTGTIYGGFYRVTGGLKLRNGNVISSATFRADPGVECVLDTARVSPAGLPARVESSACFITPEGELST